MDMLHNEDNLAQSLEASPASIITNKPIDKELLNSSRIKLINYVADEFDENFVNNIRERGIDMHLICTNKINLKQQRVKFFDYKVIPYDEESKLSESKEKISEDVIKNSRIASRKKVFKNNQQYNSHYESNSFENIDDIFLDLDWIMLYNICK